MSVKIQLLRSKINFLNAQIAGFHDSLLFSPMEIAELAAPIVPQIQDLEEEIRVLRAKENESDDADASTPQKNATKV